MVTDGTPALRWRLAPGVRVVRRGRDLLQVGLDPARRVLLPHDRRSLELLLDLRHARALPATPPAEAALETLRRQQLVTAVDPPGARPPRVTVSRSGDRWPVDPAALLRAGGARVVGWESDADGVLLLSHVEPDRSRVDPLLREGRTHLPVTLLDGGVRVGPLAVPGRTACLRCVDLHHTGDDPDHLAVLARYADAQLDRLDDTRPPADAVLVTLAVAWAAHDLLDHLRTGARDQPSWSSTLTWSPGSSEPVRRQWLRHPGCGCGWTSYAETPGPVGTSHQHPSGTMEA